VSHSVHVSEFKKERKKNGSNKKSILASDITLIDTEIILSLETNSIQTRFYTIAKTKLFRFELGQNHKNTCIPFLEKGWYLIGYQLKVTSKRFRTKHIKYKELYLQSFHCTKIIE